MLKIIFMGTPDFAKISLEHLVEKGYNVEVVVTNPDRPKGRGMKTISTPVKEYAMKKNIPVLQPDKIKRNTEIYEKLKQINPDLIIVVAYGKILPKQILDLPRLRLY